MIAMPRERNLTLTSALPLRVKVCKGLFHPRVSNKASFQTMGLGFGNGICDTAAWKQTCLLPCLFICWERDKVVMCRKHDPAPLPNTTLSFCTRCRFEVCPPLLNTLPPHVVSHLTCRSGMGQARSEVSDKAVHLPRLVLSCYSAFNKLVRNVVK